MLSWLPDKLINVYDNEDVKGNPVSHIEVSSKALKVLSVVPLLFVFVYLHGYKYPRKPKVNGLHCSKNNSTTKF